jgi:arylsulfatase B
MWTALRNFNQGKGTDMNVHALRMYNATRLKTDEAAAAAPNIAMIIVDDLGWSDVGFRGVGSRIQTPHLDTLASEGVILEQYYVQASCSPTRSAIMSGRYPLHTGINHWIPNLASYRLPLAERTLAEAMAVAGYSRHAIGCAFAIIVHHL